MVWFGVVWWVGVQCGAVGWGEMNWGCAGWVEVWCGVVRSGVWCIVKCKNISTNINIVLLISRTTFVTTLFTSGPPFVIDGPHNQTVNESDPLLLTCNIGGNPPANVSWYHDNNKELTAESVLFISHANRSHAGSYRCIASNGFGKPVTSQANVLVNCKLWFYRLSLLSYRPYKWSRREQDTSLKFSPIFDIPLLPAKINFLPFKCWQKNRGFPRWFVSPSQGLVWHLRLELTEKRTIWRESLVSNWSKIDQNGPAF